MWKEENNALTKSFQFKDFTEAFGFMTKVAIVAEKMNHHPTWTNTWNTVSFKLNTHDAGNKVTDLDRKLAQAIDQLAGK
jgi:4a-hydroxytetrahydrobiopterin dehydratase